MEHVKHVISEVVKCNQRFRCNSHSRKGKLCIEFKGNAYNHLNVGIALSLSDKVISEIYTLIQIFDHILIHLWC